MAIDHAAALRHLERTADSPHDTPDWVKEARRASHRLSGPIDHVPHGALVSIVIDVPNNRGGNFDGIVWTCRDRQGLPVEDARQELTTLMRVFLDHVLPLPR